MTRTAQRHHKEIWNKDKEERITADGISEYSYHNIRSISIFGGLFSHCGPENPGAPFSGSGVCLLVLLA